MPERFHPISGLTICIPEHLDVVVSEISELLKVEVLHRSEILVNNKTNNLCSRFITNKGTLRPKNVWKIKHIGIVDY